jgi:uncharacterized protein YdeI (YjbR/CyaY-like superfamily)
MEPTDTEIFYPASRKAWRNWLKKNHVKKPSVWLIFYKKGSDVSTLSWSDAVEEALCFGWVDSKRKPIDHEKFIQFFSKRKANGTWSKINKEKIKRLQEAGLIASAGLDVIEKAKQNGSWEILDQVEELIIPEDLKKAFKKKSGSLLYFSGLSKSVRKMLLQWLVLAKRAETRQKRIDELADLASKKMRPKQFGG